MNIDMHATIEQLLEIKDGQQNSASNHVQSCECCQQELHALRELNEQLFVAADLAPSPELWERIRRSSQTLKESQQTASELASAPIELVAAHSGQSAVVQQRTLSNAIYTLAASILVTGFIGLYLFSNSIGGQSQNELLQANIQQLMINSRGMEQALKDVSIQSELLTTAQRSEADRLYWQLAYVDQMIHESNVDAKSDPQRTEVLWNNRVKALRKLNQLYYERQKTLDESEI
jgi:hypothetical protein